MSSLINQVAIITGGSRGIGGACSKLLAKRGAKVVFSYLNNAERAEELAAEICKEGGEALAVRSDIRNSEHIENLIEQTIKTFNRIDIVVSNAPVGFIGKTINEITWEEYQAVVNGELKAAFDITKAVLPAMTAQRYGRLIYISSGLVKHPVPGRLASGTAKASLEAFARFSAVELGSSGITANIVSPGFTETEINMDIPAAEKARIAAETPLRRIGLPNDVAGVVAFLAGKGGGFLTGVTIPVNGGLNIC